MFPEKLKDFLLFITFQEEFNFILMQQEGSELIKDYGDTWTKWKFQNECFLSFNLRASNGLLTKVSCDSGIEE